MIITLALPPEYRCGYAILRDEEQMGGYVPLARSEEALAAHQTCAEALAQICGVSISDLLLGMVRDDSHPLRKTAARALATVEDLMRDRREDEDASAPGLNSIRPTQARKAITEQRLFSSRSV